MLELIGAYLAQTLEAGDFGVGTQVGDGLQALVLAVAVLRHEVGALAQLGFYGRLGISGAVAHLLQLVGSELLLVLAHAEKGRLQDVDVTLLYQFGEELQEEGNHQQTDVHAVHIGIGSYNHLVVAQLVQSVLNVQCRLQQVELLVLVHHLLGQSEAVERLAAEREHSLRLHIAALGDGAAGGVALGDEDAALLLFCALRIVEMYGAIAQFAVVQTGSLAHLARLLCHARHFLAQFLALLHFSEKHLCHIGILVQIVVHLAFHEVAHELVYRDAALGRRALRAQLHLGLTLEKGFLNIDADGSHHAVAYVGIFVVLSRIILDGFCHIFLEGCLMRAAQCCMLTVDEAVVFLAVLLRVGEGNLYVLARKMDDGIERLVVHAVVQQVAQSFAREDAPAVEQDGETRVQISVVAQHRLHKLVVELVVLEKGGVGFEIDVRAVLLLRVLRCVALQHALRKNNAVHLPVAVGARLEASAQGVHRLQTHTIQTHAFLERLAVVFSARVQHRNSLNQLAQGNATAVIAHADAQAVLHVHLYALALPHLELIDAVVDDFLHEHIDAVLGLAAVAQPANIHAGARAHVLHVAQVAYVFLVVVDGRVVYVVIFFCHERLLTINY